MRRAPSLLLALLLLPVTARAEEDLWWGPDKALHFSTSAGIAGAGYGAAALVFEDRFARLQAGALLAMGLGISKELLDLTGSGRPSWRDLAWDAAGLAVGLLLSWCVDRLLLHPLSL
jgi:putative lipoprotein